MHKTNETYSINTRKGSNYQSVSQSLFIQKVYDKMGKLNVVFILVLSFAGTAKINGINLWCTIRKTIGIKSLNHFLLSNSSARRFDQCVFNVIILCGHFANCKMILLNDKITLFLFFWNTFLNKVVQLKSLWKHQKRHVDILIWDYHCHHRYRSYIDFNVVLYAQIHVNAVKSAGLLHKALKLPFAWIKFINNQ